MTVLSIQQLQIGAVPSANPNNSTLGAQQSPSILLIATNDTNATVTAAGYLNVLQQSTTYELSFNNAQMALVFTTDSLSQWYQVSIAANGIITLIEAAGLIPGNLVVAGNITSTAGNIQALAGNVIAGSSGHAGTLSSFSATPLRGSFVIAAVANTGNTLTTLSNVAMGQASVVSIPDPANAVGRLLISATATPFVAGNFPINSGTGGLMVDSAIPVASLQLHTNIIAAQTANIGGAGAGPLNVVNASVTAASVIVASIISSSNPVSLIAVAPGAGSFNITTSADPGANLFVSYVIFVAAQ